ncbi:cytochrome P450 4C1-like isoform X1 [Vespula maculifrons]|uniref:Cytochrome P450 4C1-like isoform X1 n=1 Tax=Vespula maculifrons TaxID=7453 RepID=A0ABD2CVU4_VESMC
MKFVAILIAITTILIRLFCGRVKNFFNKLYVYNTIKEFSGPKEYPIIGNAHLFIATTKGGFLTNVLYGNPEYIKIRSISIILIILKKNSYFCFVLKTLLNSPNITDKSEKYKDLKPVMGNGSFTAPCETHVNNVSYEEELDVRHYIFRCRLDIIYGRIPKYLNLKSWLYPDLIFYNTTMGKKFRMNL